MTVLHLLALSTVVRAFSPSLSSHAVRGGMASPNLSSFQLSALLSLELEKPLGLILEEVEEGAAAGVKVGEVADGGSAFESPSKDQLIGMKIASVNNVDVSSSVFDDVMGCIIDAPSPVTITFQGEGYEQEQEEATPMLEIGTAVQIKVIQKGNEDKTIDAKVGDNLRQTLLDNKVELYRGLKKKLGNCGKFTMSLPNQQICMQSNEELHYKTFQWLLAKPGGGGQCTFCAVDMVDDEGSWQPRSDYENGRIPKFPTARLACMNNIQGPATIRVE